MESSRRWYICVWGCGTGRYRWGFEYGCVWGCVYGCVYRCVCGSAWAPIFEVLQWKIIPIVFYVIIGKYIVDHLDTNALTKGVLCVIVTPVELLDLRLRSILSVYVLERLKTWELLFHFDQEWWDPCLFISFHSCILYLWCDVKG